jgi:hypothetical protein
VSIFSFSVNITAPFVSDRIPNVRSMMSLIVQARCPVKEQIDRLKKMVGQWFGFARAGGLYP